MNIEHLTTGDCKIAEKLDGLAASMQKTIDAKMHSGEGQNYTRRRAAMAESAMKDGLRLQKIQRVLTELATMHRANKVPYVLREIKNRAIIELLMYRDHFPQVKEDSAAWYREQVQKDQKALRVAGINEEFYDEAKKIVMELAVPSAESLALKAKREREAYVKSMIGQIPGFFPTPGAVIDLMLAGIMRHGAIRVLEPSAGSGNIAARLIALFPQATVHVIEYAYSLRDYLTKEGYELVADDFLTFQPKELYDLIVMNPPFEKGQDIQHVQKAWSVLAPGGELVSIMAPSAFHNGDQKSKDFREWFETNGGEKEDLPEGSFKESGTGVASVIVRMSKSE